MQGGAQCPSTGGQGGVLGRATHATRSPGAPPPLSVEADPFLAQPPQPLSVAEVVQSHAELAREHLIGLGQHLGPPAAAQLLERVRDIQAVLFAPQQSHHQAGPPPEIVVRELIETEESPPQGLEAENADLTPLEEETGVLVSAWPISSEASEAQQTWGQTDFDQLGAKLYELKELCEQNMRYFISTDDIKMSEALMAIRAEWEVLEEAAIHVARAASRHDCDPASPGNGYRSMLKITGICVAKLLRRLRDCSAKREQILFRSGPSQQYLEDYAKILHLLRKMLQYAVATDKFSRRDELFLPQSEGDIEQTAISHMTDLDCSPFYGKRVAFYHTDRVRNAFRVLICAMAAYGDGFHQIAAAAEPTQTEGGAPAEGQPPAATNGEVQPAGDSPASAPAAPADPGAASTAAAAPLQQGAAAGAVDPVAKTATAVMQGMSYLISPAVRAEKVVERFRSCEIPFAKGFWGLMDTAPLAQHTGTLVGAWVAVNREVRVPITPAYILVCYNDGPLAPLLHRAVTCDVETGLQDVKDEFNREVEAGAVCDVEKAQFDRIFTHRGECPAPPPPPPQEKAHLADLARRAGQVSLAELAKLFPAQENHPLGYVRTQLISHVEAPAGLRRGELVIHIHGGGFVAQSPKSHEAYVRHWAKDLRAPILSIDYSLAPEAWFPRAVDECFHVYMWALQNRAELGAGREGPVVIAGDSAGGNLAVAVALKAVMQNVRVPDGVVCAYPVMNVKLAASPSRLMALMDVLLPMGLMECCLDAYRGPRNDSVSNPLMSPLQATDEHLKRLPPIRIAAAELDPLLDDSVGFARRLKMLNHDAELQVIPDMPHGFLSLAYIGGGKGSLEASAVVVKFIGDLLHSDQPCHDDQIPTETSAVLHESGSLGHLAPQSDHFGRHADPQEGLSGDDRPAEVRQEG